MRINALTRSLESAFVKHGVPFQIVKGLAFFERKENRDVLAYLRLLVNPQDTVSFLRIVNEPGRGIGKVSLDKLQAFAADQEIGLLDGRGAGRADHRDQAARPRPACATSTSIDHRAAHEARPAAARPGAPRAGEVRLRGDAARVRTTRTTPSGSRTSSELITAAKQFHDENPESTISDFLEQITLASDVDGWDEQADHVSVMTLHASKGLEFPVVYVLGGGGRAAAARAEHGQRGRDRGGAAAVLRRHDAGDEGTVPVPRPDARVPRAD